MNQYSFLPDLDDDDVFDLIKVTEEKAVNRIAYVSGVLPSHIHSVISLFFETIKLSKQIIKEEQDKVNTEEEKNNIWNSFKYLGAVHIYKLNSKLYTHFCREVIERVKAGLSESQINLGTDVECLIICMNASYKAPLDSIGITMYEQLFIKVFGELPDSDFYGGDPTSSDNYIKEEAGREIERLKKRISNSRTLNCEK